MPTPQRDDNGQFPAYAWPGGYPVIYLCADGGTLCPKCANGENGSEAFNKLDRPVYPEDRQWAMVSADIHYEGPPIHCDHCNAQIESAYGDPDAAAE